MSNIDLNTKRCYTCGDTKPTTEFNKNSGRSDGLGRQCKSCKAARSVKYRATPEAKASAKKAMDKYRAKDPAAFNARAAQRRAENPGKAKAAVAKYRASAEGKAKVKAYAAEYAKRYKERRRAKWAVKSAIKSGRLTRGPCEVCGSEPAQGHHQDYARPLDVRWLCAKHHNEHHMRVKGG